jgi:hypothetical protein
MRIRTILAAAAVPAALAATLLGTAASASAAANPNANASPATTGMTTCTTDGLSPSVITTNLNVPAGATCRLYGNEVKGNVTVQGTLAAFGATFDRNVSVTGGSFGGSNWGVTIKGNLSFVDPATNSQNGFWGNYSPNTVEGNLSYVIDSSTAYPCYQSPLLYFGGGTTVNGSFNYSDQGTGFAGHLDQTGLHVVGSKSIQMGTGSC